jgi:hypothetical protein
MAKRKGKRGRKSRKAFNPSSAPGDRALGMTEDWVLNDAVPIRLPTGYTDQTLTLAVSAGLNSFSYKIFDTSGSGIEGFGYKYG